MAISHLSRINYAAETLICLFRVKQARQSLKRLKQGKQIQELRQ